MASAFGHAALAWSLSSFEPIFPERRKVTWLMIILSILPDCDVLAFKLGIPYSHMLGHRGLTHSLFFAALLSPLVIKFFFRNIPLFSKWGKRLYILFFLSLISHGILDALTTGGLGVGFFIPFSSERYFFPFHPIEVSPLTVQAFFTSRGLHILGSEMMWIGPMAMVVLVIKKLLQKKS